MAENDQTPPPLPPKGQAPPPVPQTAAPIGQDAGIRMLIPVGRSGWAIAAGYLGLFSFILIGAPFAVITGIIAIFDIKKSRKTDRPKHGMGRAIFGIVAGVLAMVGFVFLILQSM